MIRRDEGLIVSFDRLDCVQESVGGVPWGRMHIPERSQEHEVVDGAGPIVPRSSTSRRPSASKGEGRTWRRSALVACHVGAVALTAISNRAARGSGQGAVAGARADPLWADVGVAVHILSWRRVPDGGRPRRRHADGLHAQLCGDAHLSNFGVFRALDRRLVFSINDFDETLPGPFEWDVKRLAASIAVAAEIAALTRRPAVSPCWRPFVAIGRRWRGSRRCEA